MTLQQAFNNFIRSRELRIMSPKTIDGYKVFLAPFVDFAGSETDFQTITQQTINDYIYGQSKRPVSGATKGTYIRHLKAFLHWAQDNYGAAYSYSLIKVPKMPNPDKPE